MLLPGEEEFGIASVEAQACGCPVIALKRGGAVETVVDGETGILVNQPTVEAFAEALSNAQARSFNQSIIRKNAERFSPSRFRTEFKNTVDEALNLSAEN
jgi:glycosyltransferase involved in cell wall biosynthesis